MAPADKTSSRLRVAHLNPRQPTPFVLEPDAVTRNALARELGLIDLPALHFSGQIAPAMNDAWRLEGDMTARVVQPCVVTLEPVPADLHESVTRLYSPHAADPETDDAEMPDDEIERLGQYIDLAAVMAEALALALPLYPRAPGAELAPADADAETRRPFAGLADLMKKKDGA
ncbi:YceD family protein [Paracoccus sp. DMF-8]|uniref:YceD family protein n=1 Tax=Paracoccus sp. DMF-8 TaxID=3019445 RepID=UPI0023E82983|nr:YceD family protein [Paracoccus sp. DMF-8]MDF3605385.1 YceD family protein [Paracoccus sp. DMF-8]